jgi:hypothetical protein
MTLTTNEQTSRLGIDWGYRARHVVEGEFCIFSRTGSLCALNGHPRLPRKSVRVGVR